MIVLKILGKLLLTLIYPIIFLLLKPLDQLSGKSTGFFEGLKNMWTEGK